MTLCILHAHVITQSTKLDNSNLFKLFMRVLSGSKDETRDMQDWAFKLAVRVAMATEEAAVEQCV